jgi:hypothetical protein
MYRVTTCLLAATVALTITAAGCGRRAANYPPPPSVYLEPDDDPTLKPGDKAEIKVFGKPTGVQAEDKSLMARLEGGKLVIEAAKDAKPGKHTVRVVDSEGKGPSVDVMVLDPRRLKKK